MALFGSSAGIGYVDLHPRVGPTFNAEMSRQVTPALTSFGRTTGGFAKSLGRAIGSPLGILTGAGIVTQLGRMTLEFDAAFTRISALSNVAEEDIAGFKTQVLELAGQTAKSPRELAEALFFLASAGLEASQVGPALEQSAKAAAVGLGETADVANILASALNAYKASGLTATEVTDTLVAAVREGRAEPEEFAEALGRILPIASRAGVEFDEVTASLASLSNIGLDVNEGVTAMRGLLQALVAPTKQSQEALSNLGISTEQLRTVLSEGGLLAALQLLEKRSGGNIDVLRLLVPNVRALTGELGLMGENAEGAARTFEAVANAGGSLDRAFEATQASAAFQFRQFLTSLETLAIRLGEGALPTLNSALGVLTPALGFAAENAGKLLKAFLAYKTLTFVIPQMRAQATAAQALASKVSIAAAAWLIFGDNVQRALRDTEDVGEDVGVMGTELERIRGELSSFGEGGADFFRAMTDPLAQHNTRVEEASAAWAELRGQLEESGLGGDQIRRIFVENIDLLDRQRSSIDVWIAAMQAAAVEERAYGFLQERTLLIRGQAIEATEKHTKAVREEAIAAGDAAGLLDEMGVSVSGISAELGELIAKADATKLDETVQGWADALRGDAVKAWTDFRDAAAEGIDFVSEAFDKLFDKRNLSVDQIAESFRKAREEMRSFADDLLVIARTGGEAGKDLAARLLDAGPAAANFASVVAGAGQKAREGLVRQFGGIQSESERLSAKLTDAIVGPLKNIERILKAIAKQWGVDVNLDDHGARDKLQTLQERLRAITGQTYFVTIQGQFRSPREGSAGRANEVPGGLAAGGVIAGGRGFIAERPTFLVGEGGAPEGVIPFDARGIGILSEALQKAMGGRGGTDGAAIYQAARQGVIDGFRHVTLTLNDEKVGNGVSRQQRRRQEITRY